MSRITNLAGLALSTLMVAFALPAPSSAAPPPPPPTAAPAPAIQAGESVFDRSGREVGKVQGLVETPAGAMIVASIDGKLISLPQRTLKVDGDRVVSSQSKEQMLAAAGAPR
jgi:hypothetical protein